MYQPEKQQNLVWDIGYWIHVILALYKVMCCLFHCFSRSNQAQVTLGNRNSGTILETRDDLSLYTNVALVSMEQLA